MEKLVKFYNKIFNFFFYLPCGGETRFREKSVSFASLSNSDWILDLCCGAGELTGVLACKGFTENLVGVDISEVPINTARGKTGNMPVNFLIASADYLPIESSQFDKCFISFGLHHMSPYQRQKTLSEVYRILVPAGNLYVIDYNLPERGLRRLAAIMFAKLDKSEEAYKMLEKGNLIPELIEAGFRIEKRVLTCQGIMQLLKATKK